MALFIDHGKAPFVSATPEVVFANLLVIVSKDVGIGTANYPGDPLVQRVTYKRSQQNKTPTAHRIEAMNEDSGRVLITGLPSGTVFVAHTDDGDVAFDITHNGFTFVDPAGNIHATYDSGQCYGQGIGAIGQDGSTIIQTPNEVVLYHELSHAFHFQKGIVGDTEEEEEVAATTDENVMRSQLNLAHRLVTSRYVQCGAPGGPGGKGYGTIKCLVVTAAYYNEGVAKSSARARWLHCAREALMPRSGLGGDLFGQAYSQYCEFSLQIAEEMKQDCELRRAVRELLVDPLLQVYAAALKHWLRPVSEHHFLGQLVSLAVAWSPARERQAHNPDTSAAMVQALQYHLSHYRDLSMSLDADHMLVPSAVRAVTPVIRTVSQRPMTRWSIIEPLQLYWELAAERNNDFDQLVFAVAHQTPGWISRAPALYKTPPEDPTCMADDLRAVVSRLRLTDAERIAIAARIIRLYEDRVAYDVEESIIRSGLIAEKDGPNAW
jgi:hypothetical protein